MSLAQLPKAKDQSCKAFRLNNSGLLLELVQQPLRSYPSSAVVVLFLQELTARHGIFRGGIFQRSKDEGLFPALRNAGWWSNPPSRPALRRTPSADRRRHDGEKSLKWIIATSLPSSSIASAKTSSRRSTLSMLSMLTGSRRICRLWLPISSSTSRARFASKRCAVPPARSLLSLRIARRSVPPASDF